MALLAEPVNDVFGVAFILVRQQLGDIGTTTKFRLHACETEHKYTKRPSKIAMTNGPMVGRSVGQRQLHTNAAHARKLSSKGT